MGSHGPFPKPGDNVRLAAGCILGLAFPCGTTFKTETAETEISEHRRNARSGIERTAPEEYLRFLHVGLLQHKGSPKASPVL